MAKTRDERRAFFTSTGEPSGPLAEIRDGQKVAIEGYRVNERGGLQLTTVRGQDTSDLSTLYPSFWRDNETPQQRQVLPPTVGTYPLRRAEREQYPGFFDTQGLVVGSQIGSAQPAPPTRPAPPGTPGIILPQSRQYAGSTWYQEPPGIREAVKSGMVPSRRIAAPARAPKQLGPWDWLQEKWGPLPRWAWILGGGTGVTCVAVAAS